MKWDPADTTGVYEAMFPDEPGPLSITAEALEERLIRAIKKHSESRLLLPLTYMDRSRRMTPREKKVKEVRATRRYDVTAAQWLGQSKATWPKWWTGLRAVPGASDAVLLCGIEVAVVSKGEWLLHHPDGKLTVMTDTAFRLKYKVVPGGVKNGSL